MKKPYIIHPIGGGGNWLSAVIGNLESHKPRTLNPTLWFDHVKGTTSIAYNHGGNWELGFFRPDDLSAYDPILLFSTEFIFNLYLLDAGKAKFNSERPGNILNQSTIEQFFLLSDYARFMLTDQTFYSLYCKDIDLNTRWLFQEPELFIDQLFNQLDLAQISYIKDRDYCQNCIKVFVQTCENPKNHLGNQDSIIWLGWCHALSLIHQLPVNGIFAENNIAQLLEPHQHRFIELTQPLMFEWQF